MDFQKLFLDPNGRIGRGQFWTGFLILFVLNVVGHLLGHVLSFIVVLVLIYPNVCIYSKRLHDMGKTAWLQLIPYGVLIAAIVIAIVAGGAGMIMAMAGGAHDATAATAALGGLGIFVLVMGIGLLVNLAFLLWVGLSGTQPGANQYGPEPGAAETLTAA